MSRRIFLAMAAAGFGAMPLRAANRRVRIGIIFADEFRETARGAVMAAAEALRSAQLLGYDFSHALLHESNVNSDALDGLTGVVLACENNAELPDVAIADAAHAADETASVRRPNLWYLAPMHRHRAAAQAAAAAAGDLSVEAWHHSLERFGAGQLNARFRADGIVRPASAHWLGWMAVKCLWEADIRGRSPGELAFDGHKGRRLCFDRETGNLIQPLYVINSSDDLVLAEWLPAEREGSPCASH